MIGAGERFHLCGHPDPWQVLTGDQGATRMRNRIFHQARIAGMMFEGVITESGPTRSHQMMAGSRSVAPVCASSNPRAKDRVARDRPIGGS